MRQHYINDVGTNREANSGKEKSQVIFDSAERAAAPKLPSSKLVSASGETDITHPVAGRVTSNLFDSM
jgi:hypothetical protein